MKLECAGTYMWSDNETSLDLLGFRVHADLIRSVILQSELLPITLGLFGDWGSGKTSIMQMLRTDLITGQSSDAETAGQSPSNVACLYFNSWLFEGYDDAKAAIISSVLLQLAENTRFGPKLKESIVSLLKSVNWMRVARMGVQNIALPALSAYLTGGASLIPSLVKSTKGLLSSSNIEAITESDDPQHGNSNSEKQIQADNGPSGPMDVRSFRDRFAQMIKNSDIDILVILVDDLDRCSPERVLDNLEAIKLFLSVEKTAFVIGADPRIVRHAIAHRYHSQLVGTEAESDSKSDLVTDYLEKLIQVPYYLPRLSPSETQTYMALLFCQRDLSQEAFQNCVDAYNLQLKEDRYGVFGYPHIRDVVGESNIPVNLARNLVTCASIAPLINEGLKGNPRQIKRFLNAITLRKQLANAANLRTLQDEVLAKLMVLEYGQRETEFRQLFDWQSSQKGFPEQIKQLEQILVAPNGDVDDEETAKTVDAKWATSFMRRWVAMEPYLADIDLRDYFWVVRDRLESTLSGMSMVSPIVRRLLDDLISGGSGKVKIAVKEAEVLSEDHIVLLLDLLETHISRHPDIKRGYDIIRELLIVGVNGVEDVMVRILDSVPAKAIPPAVGVDLAALMKTYSHMSVQLREQINALASTKTKIGAALTKQLQRREK